MKRIKYFLYQNSKKSKKQTQRQMLQQLPQDRHRHLNDTLNIVQKLQIQLGKIEISFFERLRGCDKLHKILIQLIDQLKTTIRSFAQNQFQPQRRINQQVCKALQQKIREISINLFTLFQLSVALLSVCAMVAVGAVGAVGATAGTSAIGAAAVATVAGGGASGGFVTSLTALGVIQGASLSAAISSVGFVGLAFGFFIAAPIGVGLAMFKASKKQDKFKYAIISVRQVIYQIRRDLEEYQQSLQSL